MGISYNCEYGSCKTALDIITKFPNTAGKNGYYMVWPQGRSGPGKLVWCDMTTDGGGWMMIARSHPTTVNYNGKKWGWQGGEIGSVKDFGQAYQAGWYSDWHSSGCTFSAWLLGNRSNINNNTWGSFIYKRDGFTYSTFMTSDTQQGANITCLKSDLSVYGSTGADMQSAVGFPVTGTANNLYYMRDCCGFSGFGATPTAMVTTYCGNDSTVYYSGPWCGGSSYDGSGNFLSGTYLTAGGNRYGGTNQYMIMVR